MKKIYKQIIKWGLAIGIIITIDHFTCNWISGGAKIEIHATTDTVKVQEISPDTVKIISVDTTKKNK